jgi:putative glutamine amidotransferase
LHQNVQDVPGMLDHREDDGGDLEQCYAPVHDVKLASGGMLERLAGRRHVLVNSLHAQGVDRLADSLLVEATAPDGLIEAFRLRDDRQFLLGVQWHPEWRVLDDPLSCAIFRSFGAACRRFASNAQHERHHELV